MYYILLHVAAESNDSILHGTTWSTLAYADDIALQDQKPKRMKRMLVSIEAEAASVGLRFNPAKCAILHVGAENGDRVLLTSFQIQRKMINPLAQGKSHSPWYSNGVLRRRPDALRRRLGPARD